MLSFKEFLKELDDIIKNNEKQDDYVIICFHPELFYEAMKKDTENYMKNNEDKKGNPNKYNSYKSKKKGKSKGKSC